MTLRKYGTGDDQQVILDEVVQPGTPEMDALIAKTAIKAWDAEDEQDLQNEAEH